MDDHTNGLPADPTQSAWAWVVGGVVMATLVITYALVGYQNNPAEFERRFQTLLTMLNLY